MTVIERERTDDALLTPVAAIPARDAEIDLLERVGLGDQDAFAVLYDRLSPVVHGVALRVLRDPSLAEEVAQDVFLTVWQKAPSFSAERGSARTWVLTLTHRRAVDIVRREQSQRDRTARASALEAQHTHDEVAEEVLDKLSTELAGTQVSRAMDSLTPLQRTTIALAYYEGLTYSQVAEQLSIPLSTAKTRIRDGLRRMASTLATPAASTG
jgi:RNA polymerase sigma-70 factor (ECF subfamily)